MSVARPWRRQAFSAALAVAVPAAIAGTGADASSTAPPSLRSDHGCYLVGAPIRLFGAGFAPGRTFDLSDDGVDFGQSTTDSRGAFEVSFRPGGLGAGVPQHVSHLNATDGSSSVGATITTTRGPGARLLAVRGNPHTLKAPFEVWGFALDGRRKHVYLHYVSPSGRPRLTASLGNTTGQCGYLRTRTRRVFPFSPSIGGWVLQIDTRAHYVPAPGQPVTRIGVRIS